MYRIVLAIVAAAAMLAACGSSDSSTSAECVALDVDKLAQIAEGLTNEAAEVTAGVAVEVPEPDRAAGVAWAAAVVVDLDGDAETAILGLGDVAAVGVVLAADHVARALFTWGEATEDGSPAGDFRDWLVSSDPASAAASCL